MPSTLANTLEEAIPLSSLEAAAADVSVPSLSLENLVSSGTRFVRELPAKAWKRFSIHYIHYLYRRFPSLKRRAQEHAARQAHLFLGDKIKLLNYHFSSEDQLDLVERILREEFHLVDADSHNGMDAPTTMRVLVYETDGPNTGMYRVHLCRLPDDSGIAKFQYFSVDRRTGKKRLASDYDGDPMQAALRRVYKFVPPAKVTGIDTKLAVDVPWQTAMPKRDVLPAVHKSEKAIDLVYATTLEEAMSFRDAGYEPIGCTFGDTSVAGPLLRGYPYSSSNPDRGHELSSMWATRLVLEGKCGRTTKFVVTGTPDPDAIYAMLVLSGMVVPNQLIAETISEMNAEPIGCTRTDYPYSSLAAFDMKVGTPCLSVEGYLAALQVGKEVFNPHSPLHVDEEFRVLAYEEARIADARAEVQDVSGDVAFVVSDGNSRDVWLKHAPIIVQYKPSQQVITIAGCSKDGARRLKTQHVFNLLGPDGLKEIYPFLDPLLGPGSGGKETIGGSPRGVAITYKQARDVYQTIADDVATLRYAAPLLCLQRDYEQRRSALLALDERYS